MVGQGAVHVEEGDDGLIFIIHIREYLPRRKKRRIIVRAEPGSRSLKIGDPAPTPTSILMRPARFVARRSTTVADSLWTVPVAPQLHWSGGFPRTRRRP